MSWNDLVVLTADGPVIEPRLFSRGEAGESVPTDPAAISSNENNLCALLWKRISRLLVGRIELTFHMFTT